jgi:hypothetical protein
MDGTASGKERPRVNVGAAPFLALALLCAMTPIAAQVPGDRTFRILQHGRPVGMLDASLSRDADGWRIRSTSRIGGTLNVTVKQFDARYDRNWRARFLTVERTAPRSSTLVHVAVGRATAHVDIVTAREARWHSHSISPDTVFLPDHAYAAFVAVAARLQDGGRRVEIPLLLVPDSERRAVVDAWERVSVSTRSGPLRAGRHTLTVIGAVPRLLHVWEAGGDLLRVDIPDDEVSVIRSDIVDPGRSN